MRARTPAAPAACQRDKFPRSPPSPAPRPRRPQPSERARPGADPGTGRRRTGLGPAARRAAVPRRWGDAVASVPVPAVRGRALRPRRSPPPSGPAGRSYLQQVLVHDLQAAAAAHALAGGAAGARGHGPRRGGGREGGGGRAGVLVGRCGARLRGSARETAVSARPPPASPGARRAAPRRPGPPVPAGPRRAPALLRGAEGRARRVRAGSGGTAKRRERPPPPQRAPAPRSPRAAPPPRRCGRSPPRAPSPRGRRAREGPCPPACRRTSGRSSNTWHCPTACQRGGGGRRGRGEAAPGTPRRVSALSACRKKVLFSSGWTRRAGTCLAGLTSCAKPAF